MQHCVCNTVKVFNVTKLTVIISMWFSESKTILQPLHFWTFYSETSTMYLWWSKKKLLFGVDKSVLFYDSYTVLGIKWPKSGSNTVFMNNMCNFISMVTQTHVYLLDFSCPIRSHEQLKQMSTGNLYTWIICEFLKLLSGIADAFVSCNRCQSSTS